MIRKMGLIRTLDTGSVLTYHNDRENWTTDEIGLQDFIISFDHDLTPGTMAFNSSNLYPMLIQIYMTT